MTNDPRKVLVVDDEANIRSMIQYIVEEMGYEVTLAENGQEAFRSAHMHDYDLMLLDIMMPNWNGVEAVKGLDFINKKPKVIVISGFVSDELRDELKDVKNVIAFVAKPFKIDELRALIKAHIDED